MNLNGKVVIITRPASDLQQPDILLAKEPGATVVWVV